MVSPQQDYKTDNGGSKTNPVEGESWTRWGHHIRSIEFDGMMRLVPLGQDSTVLEIGCGDGFQLGLLLGRFSRVLAIDPKHAPSRQGMFSFSLAEALPFRDCTFDLITSNCVVEHLKDRRCALDEMVRVLRPGGYMAHVVPARFWKAASLLFNPVGYPTRVSEKWWAQRQVAHGNSAPQRAGAQGSERPGIFQVLGRLICPPIHGTYNSHLAELKSYGRQRWVEYFTHPKLEQVAEAPLVCATQFGFFRFRWTQLRKFLAVHGLESSRVFIMRKI